MMITHNLMPLNQVYPNLVPSLDVSMNLRPPPNLPFIVGSDNLSQGLWNLSSFVHPMSVNSVMALWCFSGASLASTVPMLRAFLLACQAYATFGAASLCSLGSEQLGI